jgi:hypothetical protein
MHSPTPDWYRHVGISEVIALGKPRIERGFAAWIDFQKNGWGILARLKPRPFKPDEYSHTRQTLLQIITFPRRTM